MEYQLLPTKNQGKLDLKKVLKLPNESEYKLPIIDELLTEYDWKNNYNNYILSENDSKLPNNTYLTFAGTGCAIPSKYRNVSGCLLTLSNKNNILLDCGEGTFGQLYRVFGEDIYDQIENVKIIYNSHNHVDHNLGISKIITLKHSKEPVTVIGGEILKNFLNGYSKIENRLKNKYTFINITDLYDEKSMKEILNKDVTFQTVRVKHCEDSHAVLISDKSNIKPFTLLFSGDCNALYHSDKFYEITKNVSVLLHEGTFLNCELADGKLHSTLNQVLELANKINAYRIITTHFSQRYPKTYTFESDEESILYFNIRNKSTFIR